ncbi:MAG: leucine-rich repeat domain-containing protein [Proteobacteria bacterium]|nr:MAG: leucine-rich repeat domain-containing protein [Pseudomonadota bacterium]
MNEILPNLQSLDLDTNAISSVDKLAGVPLLSKLVISRNKILFDVSSINHLTSLETLDLSHTELFGADKLSISNIKNLSVSNVDSKLLLKFPNLENLKIIGKVNFAELKALTKIKTIEVYNCQQLVGLNALKDFPSLKKLSFTSVSFAEDESLPLISGLEHLEISSGSIVDFTALERSSSLKEIFLSLDSKGDYDLDSSLVPEISSLKKLTILTSYKENLGILIRFPDLEYLDLGGSLNSIERLPYLSKLKEINLNTNSVISLAPLANTPNLTKLIIKDNQDWSVFESLPNLLKLQEFNGISISEANEEKMKIFERLPMLEVLRISIDSNSGKFPGQLPLTIRDLSFETKSISDLSFLSNLHKMKSLEIRTQADMDIQNFSLPMITSLGISATTKNYFNLPKFPNVTQLSLNLTDSSEVISDLSRIDVRNIFTAVKELKISGPLLQAPFYTSPGIETLVEQVDSTDFLKFPKMESIKSLISGRGASLRSFKGIENFPNLEKITTSGSTQVSNLTELLGLKKLAFFDFPRYHRSKYLGNACPENGENIPLGLKNYCYDLSTGFAVALGPNPL